MRISWIRQCMLLFHRAGSHPPAAEISVLSPPVNGISLSGKSIPDPSAVWFVHCHYFYTHECSDLRCSPFLRAVVGRFHTDVLPVEALCSAVPGCGRLLWDGLEALGPLGNSQQLCAAPDCPRVTLTPRPARLRWCLHTPGLELCGICV